MSYDDWKTTEPCPGCNSPNCICDPDDYEEPIGSCDSCDSNVYEDEAHHVRGMLFCDQCMFYASNGGAEYCAAAIRALAESRASGGEGGNG